MKLLGYIADMTKTSGQRVVIKNDDHAALSTAWLTNAPHG